MQLLLVWLIAYVTPFAIAAVIAVLWSSSKHWYARNITIAHVALLVSIALSQYSLYAYGLAFPWYSGPLWFAIFGASALFALTILWPLSPLLGLGYALSAFIQQLTMLSIAFLLLPIFPIWAVVLLITPIYVVAHFLSIEHWQLKLLLVSLWGIASILLFATTHNFWLLSALHTLFGAILIRQRVLYLGIQPTPIR